MMKKGFTLVEIIISCVLIMLISTISIVVFTKDDSKEYEKIVTKVQSASAVYYDMNNELETKVKDNYGYLVLTMDELERYGILDIENVYNKLKEFSSDYKDSPDIYKKLLLVDESLAYGNEFGISFTYPYKQNTHNVYPNLYPIVIEDHEKNSFTCDYGLNESIKKLNIDYVLSDVTNIVCDEEKVRNGEGSVDVNYSLDGENVVRNVTIYRKFEPDIMVTFSDGTTTPINNIKNKYINKTVQKITMNEDTTNRDINFTKKNISIDSSIYNFGDNLPERQTATYLVSVEADLKGQVDKHNIKHINDSSTFTIDIIKPEITIIGDDKVLFSDVGSGVEYCIHSNTSLTNSELDDKWVECISTTIENLDSYKDHYFYVKDKAGNINKASIINSTKPQINITPVEDSIFKFKIHVKSLYEITQFNLKWKYQNYEATLNTNEAIGKNEYEIEVNMADLYISCASNRKCYNVASPTYSDIMMTFNLEITTQGVGTTYNKKYDIKAKNLIVQSNHYFNKDYYEFYINDNNDIVFGYHMNPLAYRDYQTGNFNIYRFKDGNKKYLGEAVTNISSLKFSGESFYLISFDNDFVEYASCGDAFTLSSRYPNKIFHHYYYKHYKHNIGTGETNLITESKDNEKVCTELIKQGTIKSTGTYKSLKTEYLQLINNVLTIGYSWESNQGYSYRDRINFKIQYIPTLFANKIYEVVIGNKEYYSIMMYNQRKEEGAYTRSTYGRVLFLPEVDLEIIEK